MNNNKLMLCDKRTSYQRYAGFFQGLLVPVSEERLTGKARLEHDLKYGKIVAEYRKNNCIIKQDEYDEAFEELIASNVELAYKWAMDFLHNKKENLHLYTTQMACNDALFALIKYVKNKYDPNRGYIVATGASKNVLRELQNNFAVAVYGTTSQYLPRNLSLINQYWEKHENNGSLDELSKEIGIPKRTVESMMNIGKSFVSLNTIVDEQFNHSNGLKTEMQDVISEDNLQGKKTQKEDKELVEKLLSCLTEQERETIYQKYGMGNLTMPEFYKKYSLSPAQYKENCEKVLDKIRQNLIY